MMKKLGITLAALAMLSACSSDGMSSSMGSMSSMGGSVIKGYVQNRCTTELQSRNEWRVIALAMTAEKQAEWENKICSCASEEAPNQLTAADMSQLLSETGRAKVAAEVTTKTVTACFKRLYQK